MTATEGAQADGQWTAGCRVRRSLEHDGAPRPVRLLRKKPPDCGKGLPHVTRKQEEVHCEGGGSGPPCPHLASSPVAPWPPLSVGSVKVIMEKRGDESSHTATAMFVSLNEQVRFELGW